MAGRSVELEEKVGTWHRVYEVVRREVVPDQMREMLQAMGETEAVVNLPSYVRMAEQVMAGDREAARVAAMLVGQNIRPAEEVT